jgi:hypothetical protein
LRGKPRFRKIRTEVPILEELKNTRICSERKTKKS